MRSHENAGRFMTLSPPQLALWILVGAGLNGCGSDSDTIESDAFRFTFDEDLEGWTTGFADYPMGTSEAEQQAIDEFYELDSGHAGLPDPLDAADGALRQSGNNHSDDLFMFLKRRIGGLEADTTYRLELHVAFATNAPSGCFGIGGSPGESVFVKGGATSVEPLRIADAADHTRWVMNIDKSDQSEGGADTQLLGDFANSKNCSLGDFSYELKTLSNVGLPAFHVTTDSIGDVWLLLGTDSGFEGTTTIYYTEVEAIFIE